MESSEDQSLGWRDEGLLAVSLLVLGYAGVLVPMLLWAIAGLFLMLLGALVTLAMWQRSTEQHQRPSSATRLAVWMLKFSGLWMLLGRALVGWLSN
jgi:hypothetical protein